MCATLVPHLATKDTVRREVTVGSFYTPVLRTGTASGREEREQDALHGPSQPVATVVGTGDVGRERAVANVGNCPASSVASMFI